MNTAILSFVAGTVVGGFVVFASLSDRGITWSDRSAPPLAGKREETSSRPVEGLPSPGAPVASAAGKEEDVSRVSHGIASFYGVKSNGTVTASGVPLNDSVSTAAHRTLPFGTLVRVTNLGNGLSETVEITDRGPFTKGRVIDLSRNAAGKLDMIKAGIVSVELKVLSGNAEMTTPSLVKE